MKKTTIAEVNTSYTEQDVLKTTALIYLQEAIFNQQYEQCAQLIKQAKEVGATASDIKEIITLAVKTKTKNRLRGLKEK